MYGKTPGLRIRFLRDQLGFTEDKLGQLVNLNGREIYQIEMGLDKISESKPWLLERLAQALRTTATFILYGENQQELHGERSTLGEINRMWKAGKFRSRDEMDRFIDYASLSIRQRNNTKIPLSQSELEKLLQIMRGADEHQLRF